MPGAQPVIASIKAISLHGFEGGIVNVETDIRAGLPSLRIVGMGNKAVDEAQHRVRSAVLNAGLTFPAKKLTINLSPANLPKQGTHFDLPIAVSILQASSQLKARHVQGCAFFGELSLSGDILPIKGVTLGAEAAAQGGCTSLYLPYESYAQASLIEGVEIIPVKTLKEVFQRLIGVAGPLVLPSPPLEKIPPKNMLIDSIVGQESAKRALMLAIAGRHNILLYGPPGTGKTHLARAALQLLPPLSKRESIEVTKLHGLSKASGGVQQTAPLRAPHHSVTRTALLGGGLTPTPGDISLAHNGVLLLDELPEYPRAIIESLRQPLEDKQITLTRLYGTITYPADCIVIATMNPCPCGFYGDPDKQCSCSHGQIQQYKRKLSGPILDRIDLFAEAPRLKDEYFFDAKVMTKNQQLPLADSIKSIRRIQNVRYKRRDIYNGNADMNTIKKYFNVTADTHALIKQAQRAVGLSPRGILRVLRVARTIADAETSPSVEPRHAAEALQFRSQLND